MIKSRILSLGALFRIALNALSVSCGQLCLSWWVGGHRHFRFLIVTSCHIFDHSLIGHIRSHHWLYLPQRRVLIIRRCVGVPKSSRIFSDVFVHSFRVVLLEVWVKFSVVFKLRQRLNSLIALCSSATGRPASLLKLPLFFESEVIDGRL